jgi:hypothetical protein
MEFAESFGSAASTEVKQWFHADVTCGPCFIKFGEMIYALFGGHPERELPTVIPTGAVCRSSALK